MCILPSLWWESEALVAVEAMANGIAVVASDRGALPETLGSAGVVLPLPKRLQPTTRELPTVTEVEPWIKTIIGLWDDSRWYGDQSLRAAAESRRWAPELLEPQYIEFFRGLRCRAAGKTSDYVEGTAP